MYQKYLQQPPFISENSILLFLIKIEPNRCFYFTTWNNDENKETLTFSYMMKWIFSTYQE